MPPLGLPRDPAQWLALALALAALLAARPLLRPSPRPRLFAALAALAAAALSAAYVAVYLRGGPRIIDATSYWLEARALAHGLLSFPLRAPETSVLGRFLVRSEHPDGPHAAVIFPPGYPAVLALGFLARAPLAVGPVLAAGIVVVTFDLAGHVARSLALPRDAPSLPRLAALFSVVCAALRYHTADTMSHGLAALCFACALSFAFHASDALAAGRARRAGALAAAAGLSAGWLFATRPVSAIALAAALAFALAPARRPAWRLVPMLALGAIPGAALFLAHQHAATGAWGASSQRLYYAVSDGPPGCFRYGFGAGVGCLGEHGDFVQARLAHGFGFLAAAGTTLRRLEMHLVDPANAEPLALLVPLGAWIARGSARARVLAVAVAAQIAAYVALLLRRQLPRRRRPLLRRRPPARARPRGGRRSSSSPRAAPRRSAGPRSPSRSRSPASPSAPASITPRSATATAAGPCSSLPSSRAPASRAASSSSTPITASTSPSTPRGGRARRPLASTATPSTAWPGRRSGRPPAFRYRFVAPTRRRPGGGLGRAHLLPARSRAPASSRANRSGRRSRRRAGTRSRSGPSLRARRGPAGS